MNPETKPTQELLDHWDNVTALDAWVGPAQSQIQAPDNDRTEVRLASASWDMSVRVYRWSSLDAGDAGTAEGGEWTQLHMLRGHGSAVWGVRQIDAERTLTACADMRIRLFVGTQLTKQFLAHDDVVRTLAVWPGPTQPSSTTSPAASDSTGVLFASSGNDGRIIIWDMDRGSLDSVNSDSTRNGDTKTSSTKPSDDPNADSLAVAGESVPGAPALARILIGHESTVYDLAVLPSESGPPRLISASEDGTVRIWSTSTGEQLEVLPHKVATVWSVAALSVPGADTLITACSDGHVCIWNDHQGTNGPPGEQDSPLDLAEWKAHARAGLREPNT